MNTHTSSSDRHSWRFLFSAFAASWLVWSIVLIGGQSIHHSLSTALQMAGFFAVGAMAVYSIYQSRDRSLAHEFWCSVFDIRRISVRGWAFALLLMPAMGYLATMVDSYWTGHPPTIGALFQPGLEPVGVIKQFGFGLIVGPLLEELAWRGVALGPLQRRYGALGGALTLGCVHALWHLPLFLLPTGYLHSLGILTPAFWGFMAEIVVFNLIDAALFNFTRASVLAAILFHCSFNSVGALWDLSPKAAWYFNGFAAGLAALLVLGTRARLFLRD